MYMWRARAYSFGALPPLAQSRIPWCSMAERYPLAARPILGPFLGKEGWAMLDWAR